MGWVFGLLDAKSVPKSMPTYPPLPPPPFTHTPVRSVPASWAFLFFLSFFFSFFLYVLTSMEGSAPVCCTIQFMTTTCFQAILQTAIEINLPMFSFRTKEGRSSTILLSFSIYTHVLNLETYWWLRVIDTISDIMWLVEVFVAPSLWHDHDQSLSNKLGATMSIMLIKLGASLSKKLGEYSINNCIFIQKSEKNEIKLK